MAAKLWLDCRHSGEGFSEWFISLKSEPSFWVTCEKDLVIHRFQQQDTYNYTSLICTCCEKGYSLNMVACVFAADVITQNIVCRQGPSTILCYDCAKDVHTLFQHLVTQMFSVLYTRWREKENEGNFGPF